MKRVIWAIVGLSLAFSLIFYQFLLSVIASWFLHAYSAANWASPLQYDRLFISGNQLVIVKPRMERGVFFSASQIRATLGLNLIERSLEVDVDIHFPHWDFQTDRLIFSENFEKLLGSEEKWFKINPRIHLKSGSLAWNEEDSSTPRSLEFDLEFKPQDGGSIEVNFSRGILSLNSSKNADAMEVNCRCQTIDCPSLLATLRFFGFDCPQWEVPSGQIEGEIKAVFPKKLRPYFEGELYVENLAFQWGEKELEGKIGLSRILLEKNEAISKPLDSALAEDPRSPSDKLDRPFFATIGRLDILQPASLRCLSLCHPWEVEEIVGSIQLDQTDAAKIDLHSVLESHRWRLQGNANINANRALDLGLNLTCSSSGRPDGKIQLDLTGQKTGLKIAQVKIEKLTYVECSFLQTFLAMGWPVFHEVDLKRGEFNASIEADVTERGIEEIRVKQFEASNLISTIKPLRAACQFDHVRGYGRVNLRREDFWQTLSAGLHLEDGSIQFEDFNSSFAMNDIQAHLFIHQGEVDHSLVTLQIGGLKGKMDVEWGRHKQVLTFKLDGIAEDTAGLLPSLLHEGLAKHFRGNRLMVRAILKRLGSQVELGGTLHIQRANTERMDVIHFGCELKGLQRNKVNDGAARKLPRLKERNYASIDNTGIVDLFQPLRALRRPARNLKRGNGLVCCRALNCGLDCVKAPGVKDCKRAFIDNRDPFALFQARELTRRPTRNLKRGSPLAAEKRNIKLAGWFHAHQLPVEKFISPFIFRNNSLQMSGVAELKGTFDDRSILIKYDADDIKIENENLCIAIPSLHSPMPGQLVGTHRIDLSDYTYHGNLPIHSASYFEKNTGVEFKDIQATASFKNGFIRLSPIEAYCEGIYLAGDLELDLSDPLPGVFDLTVQCPTLFGKVFQVRQLLSQIDPASLLRKIPLEGEVSCREKGLKLKFAFLPLNWRFEADFSGKITDGSIALEEADMALRGIYLDLDYNHGSQLLKFSDIQGTLLVGKPRRVEEYLLSGHHIHFDQITEPEPSLDFDVAIKDSHQELFRAAGFTKKDPEGFTSIHLDQKLSHISCITPDDWQCKLKDWSCVEKLKFSSKFDLGKFLQDLQRFRRTGLLFLSHGVIERIAQFLPVEGDAYLELDLRPDQMYSFHCQGSGIKQGGSKEISAVLKGCKQGKKWLVDQLSWDDWNLSFELHQAPEKWRIPFLGLKVGSDVLLGLDGDWYEEEGLLLAKLNFCEVDCSLLERFATTQPFAASWSPKGALKATGNIEWNIFSQNPWDGCKISLSAKAEGLTLRGFPFEVGNVFQLSLLPARPWVLENVQIIINPESYFFIKQLEYPSAYSNGHQTLIAEFQIPCHHLKMLGDSLHHHFSDIADFSAKDMLAEAKREGCLKGNLFVESFPSNPSSIRIELEDGLYAFKKREYDLKGPQIFISSNGLEFSAFTHHERFPFQIRGKMHWPGCLKGEVMLFGQGDLKPLAIAWSSSPSGKPFFQSIAGEFCGCKVFLKGLQESAENCGWQALEGEINMDIHRLCPLLTPALSDGIKKLKIGSTCCLKGNFWFDPERGKSLLEASSFRGALSCENPIFKGYQMQSLQADMQFVPGRLDVQNLSIQDPAGCIKAPHCIVLKGSQSEKWTFFLPSLSVKNLKLSQLKSAEVSPTHTHSYSKFRSMMLKKFELQDARGELDDVRTWKAEGNLHFLNPSRKNVFHPLFAIPAEIILRLGLNPHVLNPISGVIFFTLKGDRFYLNRFKDVYSEGRGSKFNLAEGPGPSWVDFNGDLSVNIRMKQYNLIFKIAELFTVSIHGNIKKPRYSLQKQTKSPRKSELLHISNSPS